MDRLTRGIAMRSARHPWRTIVTWALVMGLLVAFVAYGRYVLRPTV